MFVAGLRNHIIIENVRVNNKKTVGTKNLKLVDNNINIDFTDD